MSEIQFQRTGIVPHCPSVDDAEETGNARPVFIGIIQGIDKPQIAVAHIFNMVAITADGVAIFV